MTNQKKSKKKRGRQRSGNTTTCDRTGYFTSYNKKRKKRNSTLSKLRSSSVSSSPVNTKDQHHPPDLHWLDKKRRQRKETYKAWLEKYVVCQPDPSFYTGTGKPIKVSAPGDKLVLFGDGQTYYPWFVKKQSNIQNAGVGLFAATNFHKDQILSVYTGRTTTDSEEGKQLQEDKRTRGYVVRLKIHGGTYIAPLKSEERFFAHYMNHKEKPNCTLDHAGRIAAKRYIPKGAELTLDYGDSFVRDW